MSKKLSKEVADKYDLVGIMPGKINHATFGTLDFTTMGIEEADTLYRGGIEFLKLKVLKPPKTKKDNGLG